MSLIIRPYRLAGGIGFGPDGTLEGGACWRADGTVAALGGGRARPGIRFWPGRAPDKVEDTGQQD